MRLVYAVLEVIVLLLMSATAVLAQSSQPAASVSVPHLINISGVFQPADGQPPGSVEAVTLAIYAEAEGGTPLWQETQSVALDAAGRYTVLLGATHAEGIPPTVFASGEARWLGTLLGRAGEVEGPRVRITSVPYALRAADAETLAGRPASAYVLAPIAGTTETRATDAAGAAADPATPQAVLPGTTNFLAKYVNGNDVADSAVYETAGSVGIGTTVPLDALHVRFNNTGGTMTGLAVQNLGSTGSPYSGMLFYDQNGALGQFQGFNNLTHEYRINNVARNGSNQLDGSINFMTGSTSRFFVSTGGNVGIGTTAPSALLEVSNALPGGPANMWMTSFTNAVGPYYMARRSRGTPGVRTAVQNGDGLAGFYGEGYGTTAFGPGFAGGMTVQAAQNWTDTAHGTALTFSNTPINSTSPVTRMTLDASGFLGIGTITVPAAGILEVSNAASTLPFTSVTASTFAGSGQGSLFIGRRARGTAAAPSAVQSGDVLAGLLGRGYGATTFGGTVGGMLVGATENWTDTAQGANVTFNTTPIGTITPTMRMIITSAGDVGIGTFPEAALEVVRDGNPAELFLTSYGGVSDSGESNIELRVARGTAAAPSAVQEGDELGGFFATGYGASGFGDGVAGMGAFVAENWTDAAQGAGVYFLTTPLGSTEPEGSLVILPGGNVGIGTFGAVPTIPDKLQVFGDIRVGTTGTEGCLKNFNGDTIIGTCSSDRRFKRDITPFGPVLGQLTALQPVHYFWRAAEFPGRHFGDSRAYGLIAQEAEQVLPELVVTGADGFKAVDYSRLPLLTIQAVKELKAEHDDSVKELKTENDALKRRVAELERLVTEMLATATRR